MAPCSSGATSGMAGSISPERWTKSPAGVHLRDPGVQFADMNGDGRADLLVPGPAGLFPAELRGTVEPARLCPVRQCSIRELRRHRCPARRPRRRRGDRCAAHRRELRAVLQRPDHGLETVETRPRQPLEVFPDVSFSDPRVKLADLTGDGLQDIVLVQQGRIDYWPYLGHGRWGRRVTMRNSPVFRDVIPVPDGFDPKRVLFGDVDGDGLADLVYLEPNRLTFWINQGGNAGAIRSPSRHPAGHRRRRRAPGRHARHRDGRHSVDLRSDSRGREHLPVPGSDRRGQALPARPDGQPHGRGDPGPVRLLDGFYLADDEQPETRWKTPLPFPVQVVARVEVIDQISGGKLTTEYRYHHGYWDGTEREFRGFGLVEQLDTEIFADVQRPRAARADDPVRAGAEAQRSRRRCSPRPGSTRARSATSSATAHEVDCRRSTGRATPRPCRARRTRCSSCRSLPAPPTGATPCGPCAGRSCAPSSTPSTAPTAQDRPYTVTEQPVRAPRGESRRRAATVSASGSSSRTPLAQRTTQWERGDEPMTQFAFTDDYDAYGQPRRQVSLAVPRHRDYRVPAPAGAPYLGTLAETRYAQRDDARAVHRRSRRRGARASRSSTTAAQPSSTSTARSKPARRDAS